jgi:hypothetical protein
VCEWLCGLRGDAAEGGVVAAKATGIITMWGVRA